MPKKSSMIGIGLVCSLLVPVLGAEKKAAPDLSKLPPAAKQQVDFAKDIKPLFEKSCLKCHSGEKPKSKYRLENREAAIKGGESGDAAIIPGKSEKSPMIHFVADLIEEMEMPPTEKRDKYPALTKDQIGLLRAWIDQGAKWE